MLRIPPDKSFSKNFLQIFLNPLLGIGVVTKLDLVLLLILGVADRLLRISVGVVLGLPANTRVDWMLVISRQISRVTPSSGNSLFNNGSNMSVEPW